MDDFEEQQRTRHDRDGSGSRAADGEDLQASLRELAVVDIAALTLTAVLTRVATSAVRAIPGADGVGVMLGKADDHDGMQARSASAPFVAEIEAIQYEVLHEGPGITAVAQGRTVWTESLDGDVRWLRFGLRGVGLGVHSALGVPLTVSGQVIGVLTVYAHGTDAFDTRSAQLAEQFAGPAAVTVHNARVLAQAQQVTTQLETALTSRAIVDQAVGILISRSGGTAAEALARLRAISQAENQRLIVAARHIVDEAARRARARHTDH